MRSSVANALCSEVRKAPRAPENVETLRQIFLQSQQRSARTAFGLCAPIVGRIFHLGLVFHPYKLMVV